MAVQAGQREKFSSQPKPELLAALREIARSDGRHFQAVLEDAISSYIEARAQHRVCPEVIAHYQASLERNRMLYKLLAR